MFTSETPPCGVSGVLRFADESCMAGWSSCSVGRLLLHQSHIADGADEARLTRYAP